jgi:hypothetical protein
MAATAGIVTDRRALLRGALLVGAVWAAGQALLLVTVGPRLGGDSARYLDEAAIWLSGARPASHALLFSTYSLYVAACLGAGLGTVGIVLGQVALSGAAAWWLYRLAALLYEPRVGLLAALLYVGYPELQIWNVYLLTESLFVSLTVLALFLLVRADRPGAWVVAALATVAAAGVRPHGLALLGAAAGFGLATLWRARRPAALALVALAAVAAGVAGWIAIGGMLGGWLRPARFLQRGVVIWGYPAAAVPRSVPPAGDALPAGNALWEVVAAIWAHPGHALHVATLRVGYEWVHARPYYSTVHNAVILATLLPLYALAAWGLRGSVRRPGARGLLLGLLGLQSLIVALTFADWDGRHLLVMLPPVFVFAAAGAWDLVDRWVDRWRTRSSARGTAAA